MSEGSQCVSGVAPVAGVGVGLRKVIWGEITHTSKAVMPKGGVLFFLDGSSGFSRSAEETQSKHQCSQINALCRLLVGRREIV